MKRGLGFIVLGLGLAWACGDDEKRRPFGTRSPDAGEGGESGSSTGGKGAGGTGKGGSAGGTSGESGSGAQGGASSGNAGTGDTGGGSGEGPGGAGTGTGGTGGIPPCESTAPPTSFSGDCDPEATIGATMDVPLLDAAATLLSITPDELTIAWYGATLMGDTYYVADRASVNDSFGAGEQRPAPVVALSPDGLRLVELSSDGRSFIETTRTARGTSFGTAGIEGSFATLNADAASRGLAFSGCVISQDDRTLYYVASDGSDDQPLRVSTRTSTGPWPVGTKIMGCEFQAHGDLVIQPTGVSADGLTLFVYDWPRRQARAAWRSSTSAPFEWFSDLGMRENAQPNAACDRLYYSSARGPSFSSLD